MANILQTLRRSDIELTRHWADIIVLTLGRNHQRPGRHCSKTLGKHRADKIFVVKAGPEVLAS